MAPRLVHRTRLLALSAFLFGIWHALSAGEAQERKELKIPDRERLTLSTKDGVQLSCYYYRGGFQKMDETITELNAKQVVPVMLIHGWGGQASEFDGFAAGLQSMGYAVVVPDLRGHGQSTLINGRTGAVAIDFEKMKPRDAASMWMDLEAVKTFLLQRHNAGELNIDMLAVVGASEGALLAMNWTVKDWSRPQLPAFRQGQDVKLMILLSPPLTFGGMRTQAATAHVVVSSLPCLIAVGARDGTAYKDAERLFTALKRRHANPDETLPLVSADTDLQGTALLDERWRLPVAYEAARFLHTTLFERAAQYPWQERPNPLGEDR